MSWLENSMKEAKNLKDHYIMQGVDIFIKDKLDSNIDVDFVVRYISTRLPKHLMISVDIIYVGHFKMLVDREVTAIYEDGAIYLSNEQDSEMDMIDDLIHEIAHSNEKRYQDIIYGDGKLESEFLAKRRALQNVLLNQEKKYKVPIHFALDPTYSNVIDDFLYKDVGYSALWQMVPGIFPSPYAATSLREYFARGFEEYFMGNPKELKEACPVLYSKMYKLHNMED
ncbi:MAG: hypothetical protein GOVbin1807_161 [Prokaryotic dsDNA virus sp.]|nr:MAG: hypothetical protein GOVbin1807_161 [Prokaryotic dsDNA virus sp.]